MSGPVLRLLRAADARRMPWKNGGGETIEYAVEPHGAGLDDFIWRLSTAHVTVDGPFSAFPGVDRTLLILQGAGLELTLAGAAPRAVTPTSAPLSFPADVATHATLLGGPVLDLNVMTRRTACRHAVRTMDVDGAARLALAAPLTVLFCRHGRIALPDGDTLGPRDAAVISGGAALRLEARPPAGAVAVAIFPA